MAAENEPEHPKEEEEADVPMEVVADDDITATSVTTKDITPTTSTTAANITESNPPPPPPQEESSEEEGEEEDDNNNNNNGIEEETPEKTAKEPLLRILELIPEPDPCAATTTTTTTKTATATSESTSTPAANNITTATDAQNALSELFMLDQTPAKGSKKSVRPGNVALSFFSLFYFLTNNILFPLTARLAQVLLLRQGRHQGHLLRTQQGVLLGEVPRRRPHRLLPRGDRQPAPERRRGHQQAARSQAA